MDLLDRLAEELHNGWWKYLFDQGFVLGPDKIDDRNDPEHKKQWMHPHMSNWSGKCTTDKNQDRYAAALILHSWFKHELTKAGLVEQIHEFWREWMKIVRNRDHPHDFPFREVHNTNPKEHAVQADRVYAFLEKTFLGKEIPPKKRYRTLLCCL